MSFFSLALALLAQYFRPFIGDNPIHTLFHRFAAFIEAKFNAGQRRYGLLAWVLAVLLLIAPAAIIYWWIFTLGPAGKLVALAINAAVLYFVLRFRSVSVQLRGVQQALQRDDIDDARTRLAQFLGRSVSLYERNEISRVTIEQMLLSAHRDLFGPILWFLVLPGPLGPLLFLLTRVLAETWSKPDVASGDIDHGDVIPFSHFANQFWDWIDWVPRRVTALSFAIAGDFQDAMECWRAQSLTWGQADDGIVLASGAGALGVRLGQPLTTVSGADYRPEIGTGEMAEADFIESAEGLVWRALALWMSVLVLVTLASAVTWITHLI